MIAANASSMGKTSIGCQCCAPVEALLHVQRVCYMPLSMNVALLKPSYALFCDPALPTIQSLPGAEGSLATPDKEIYPRG